MHFSGLHRVELMGYPATRKSVSWLGAALFRFRENKIAELWVLGAFRAQEMQLKKES
ncbi:MAG: ester cyclase [Gammaproteobacteria bacterium]|nr:ester cyclase [Gammaproteobacteria bacterium]